MHGMLVGFDESETDAGDGLHGREEDDDEGVEGEGRRVPSSAF